MPGDRWYADPQFNQPPQDNGDWVRAMMGLGADTGTGIGPAPSYTPVEQRRADFDKKLNQALDSTNFADFQLPAASPVIGAVRLAEELPQTLSNLRWLASFPGRADRMRQALIDAYEKHIPDFFRGLKAYVGENGYREGGHKILLRDPAELDAAGALNAAVLDRPQQGVFSKLLFRSPPREGDTWARTLAELEPYSLAESAREMANNAAWEGLSWTDSLPFAQSLRLNRPLVQDVPHNRILGDYQLLGPGLFGTEAEHESVIRPSRIFGAYTVAHPRQLPDSLRGQLPTTTEGWLAALSQVGPGHRYGHAFDYMDPADWDAAAQLGARK